MSASALRIGMAVLLLTSIGWAARNVARDTPDGRTGSETTMPAADRRQREILEGAIGGTPDPTLVGLYSEINSRHFKGQLPAIPVVWEPRLAEVGLLASEAFTLEGMFGHIGDRSIILLNPDLARDNEAIQRALSHEMVHAWLHSIGDPSTGHGPTFQSTLKRLSDEGAFAGIVASPGEREHLRVWLESESKRIDTLTEEARRDGEALAVEAREIERSLAELNGRRRDGFTVDEAAIAAWTLRRDTHNRRVAEVRARAERAHADASAFNEQVERYNLMVSYPDGLDEPQPLANRR